MLGSNSLLFSGSETILGHLNNSTKQITQLQASFAKLGICSTPKFRHGKLVVEVRPLVVVEI